jgi:zinc transport system permease protein
LVFDENFARVAGVDTEKIETILVLVSAAAVVVAMKVAGIMLVSAMIIIPPSAALQLAADFKRAVLLACAFSVGAVLLGIYFAFLLNLPCSAVIIVINILILIFCSAGRKYATQKRASAKID